MQQACFPVEHNTTVQLQPLNDGRKGATTVQMKQDNGTLSSTQTGQVFTTFEGALVEFVDVDQVRASNVESFDVYEQSHL